MPAYGNYIVEVTVDPYNDVAESNENNNEKRIKISLDDLEELN